ncbi:ependymin-like isoform X2 [Colossoma macropomum]|uniref:ependymin-like isoform X2 n=1 Tax=Colossoma macropomum TaxID=42526 RepID=UPI001863B6E1|nr:ependymin-like isoform X2 [Colossoma macropomum]
MKLLVLLSICSCLALKACAQPTPCVSPPFMTGNAYMHTEIGAITTSGTFDYDALGQQIRIRSSGSSPSGAFSVDLLMQFQQKVAYEIDYSERTCKKVALDAPFNPIQIPPGSFPVAQTVLGTSSVAGMGLLANTWYGEIPEIQAMYTLVFSDNACVPLSGTYYSPETGTIIISFYNILLGVRDPMDFIPPYFCQTEDLKKVEDLPKTNCFRLISSVNKQF